MNADDLLTSLRTTFGAEASVRARRPRLYQLSLPTFMADGDQAQVFVRLRDDGACDVTDLGQTMMRLSYTRRDADETRSALAALAMRHGFKLEEDQLTTRVPSTEVLGGALGLVQIESEAEASIRKLTRVRVQSKRFKALVVEALTEAFEKCHLGYHAPADEEGTYSIDARIEGPHATLLVAIVPTDLEAERAVGSKLYLERAANDTKLFTRPEHWVAIPRDIDDLQRRTATRLMAHYLVPVPKYEDTPALLVPRLEKLVA